MSDEYSDAPPPPEPTDLEEQLAYELLKKPAPLTMSPVRWYAHELARHRERLLAPIEQLVPRLPPREALALRDALALARGQPRGL